MLRRITICSLFISTLISSAFSQESNENSNETRARKNFFYISPVDLFFKTMKLGYERRLNNNNTVFVLGGFKFSEQSSAIARIGGNVEVQYHVNLFYNKELISKVDKMQNFTSFFYFSPYLQYHGEQMTDQVYNSGLYTSNVNSNVNSYFGGVGFGWRFSGMENRFALNFFAGGGLKYSNLNGLSKYSDFLESGYTGFAPKLGFQAGIAF